jgi:cytochrome b561
MIEDELILQQNINQIYKFDFLAIGLLCLMFTFIWFKYALPLTEYNYISYYNKIIIITTLCSYALFTVLSISKVFWFDTFYNSTKTQSSEDLQMTLSWDTFVLIYFLVFVMNIIGLVLFNESKIPKVAVFKKGSLASAKELLNMQQ